MYEKSKAKSELILKLYNEGADLKEISKQTASSSTTIKKVLKTFFDIDYDAARTAEYQDRLRKVVELYEQGKPQIFIEKELKLTRKTIRNLLKSVGVDYRDKSSQWLLRYGNILNEACFDELTPEALYWIGMLYSDGHVTRNRENSIELTQHSADLLHLEKFRGFLGSSRPVTKGHGDCHRVRVNSKKIHDRLLSLGLTHDKSYTAVPNLLLKDSKDFWRGVLDGDGGVYNYESTPSIFLCGTLETIFDFIIFCNQNIGIKDKYPTKAFGKSLHQVHYYGQDAIKIADFLYKDSSVYLERKYNEYLKILKRLK